MSTVLMWRRNARKELETLVKNLEDQFEKTKGEIANEAETDTSLIPPSGVWYWAVVGLYLIALVILGIGGWFLTDTVKGTTLPINIGVTIWLLEALHFGGSLKPVGVNDLAGFVLFRRPWFFPKTGLYIVPLGIMKTIKADRNYKDVRFPGPADKIFRISKELQASREGGDMPPEEKGLVRPIFVVTGEPKLTGDDIEKMRKGGVEENPLDRQLTVEVSYFVRYRPDQNYGGIFRISRNLSSQTGEINERIKDLMREQSERDMKSVLSRHTPATIIENWEIVNKAFVLKLRLAAMRLGIDVDVNGAGLDDLNISHQTSEAQAEVSRAKFKRLKTIVDADAESTKRQKEREGDAKGELAWLKALAEGRAKLKKRLGVSGEAVLGSEAVREVLKETDVILAGGESGMRDMLAIVKGAQSALSLGGKIDSKKGEQA